MHAREKERASEWERGGGGRGMEGEGLMEHLRDRASESVRHSSTNGSSSRVELVGKLACRPLTLLQPRDRPTSKFAEQKVE